MMHNKQLHFKRQLQLPPRNTEQLFSLQHYSTTLYLYIFCYITETEHNACLQTKDYKTKFLWQAGI